MQIDINDIQKRIAEKDTSVVRAMVDVDKRIDEEGNYEFTMSDEIMDRHGTIVKLGKGANIKEYQKNPILLWMHQANGGFFGEDYNPDNVIGYTKTFIKDGKLKAVPFFEGLESTGNELAEKIKKKIDFGSLRGLSIGFIPLSGSMGTKELEEDENVFYIRDWTLIENSIVTIPSNPNGLIEITEKQIKEETQDQEIELPTRKQIERARRILTLIKLKR